MEKIIGREQEIQALNQYSQSGKAEFIAVYGRRRVGKTFLIRQWACGNFAFEMSGLIEGEMSDQMNAFVQALHDYGAYDAHPKTWFDAFVCLRDLLKRKLQESDERVLVFLDELPCLDTSGSKFRQAIDHFWNSWGAWQDRLMLIVCGSATSWIIRNIVDAHGGLHNRVTHEIALKPFTLGETEKYLNSRGFVWPRLSILHAYMALGGVPYYLSLLQPEESFPQAIDRLFFRSGGELHREYRRLFRGLFRNPEPYMDILRELASTRSGLTRDEISARVGRNNNGHLSEQLEDLVQCDFIRLYHVREKKIKQKSGIYQLIDFYSIFWHTFAARNGISNYWTSTIGTHEQDTWFGLAFERVCLAHVEQIRMSLHLNILVTQCYSWRSKCTDTLIDGYEGDVKSEPKLRGAQIDLIIERSDQMINLCECKYSNSLYHLNAQEDLRLRNREACFRRETGVKAGIYQTLITTFGLAKGQYAQSVPVQLTMDALFI